VSFDTDSQSHPGENFSIIAESNSFVKSFSHNCPVEIFPEQHSTVFKTLPNEGFLGSMPFRSSLYCSLVGCRRDPELELLIPSILSMPCQFKFNDQLRKD
jgi:hypothetical protein